MFKFIKEDPAFAAMTLTILSVIVLTGIVVVVSFMQDALVVMSKHV